MSTDVSDDQLEELARSSRSKRMEAIFDYHAIDWQARLVDDDTPDKVVNCGRQVGKTETGGAIAADWATRLEDETIALCARFQGTADEMFDRFTKYMDNTGMSHSQLGVVKDNEREWEFATGVRVISRPLPKGAAQFRGKLPKVIVVDESAIVHDNVFERVIRPMFTTHGYNHELILMSSPAGKNGYHYEKFADDDRFETFTAATPDFVHAASAVEGVRVVDDTAEQWLADEREETDDITWQQEYLAEFVDEGEVYIPSDIVEPLVGSEEPPFARGTPLTMAVDIGRGGDDHTVFTGIDGRGSTRVLHSEKRSTIPGIVSKMESLHREYGFDGIFIDETAVGGGVADLADLSPSLERVIEPVTFSSKSKQSMYRALKTAIERGMLTLPDHDRLLHELTHLEFDFTRNDLLRVSAPPGGHDDYPDSLALAVWGSNGGGQPGKRRRRERRNPEAYAYSMSGR